MMNGEKGETCRISGRRMMLNLPSNSCLKLSMNFNAFMRNKDGTSGCLLFAFYMRSLFGSRFMAECSNNNSLSCRSNTLHLHFLFRGGKNLFSYVYRREPCIHGVVGAAWDKKLCLNCVSNLKGKHRNANELRMKNNNEKLSKEEAHVNVAKNSSP